MLTKFMRFRGSRWLTGLVGASLLAACQPRPSEPPHAEAAVPASAPTPTPTPAVAATISDFSQPMTALGTEPFWSVIIDGTRFKLTRPDHPDLTAEAPGAAIQPGKASWLAKAADGQTLAVTLYVSACSDGMSDRAYPMTAEVVFGAETLHGCAIKTADMRREGGASEGR